MRTSSRKTTAAVLRDIIGIKVPEWAELLDRSPHTVHDLESGRLQLSPELATMMNYQTGISIKWLMNGDPAAPAVSADGRDYTKAIFEDVQGRKKSVAHVKENQIKADAIEFLRRICNILVTANRKRCYHLTAYWVGKALDEWSAQLGDPKDFKNYEELFTYVQGVWQRKEPGLPLVPPPEHARNIWEGLRKAAQAKTKSKRPLTKRRRQ